MASANREKRPIIEVFIVVALVRIFAQVPDASKDDSSGDWLGFIYTDKVFVLACIFPRFALPC